jgi:hypothetical protein
MECQAPMTDTGAHRRRGIAIRRTSRLASHGILAPYRSPSAAAWPRGVKLPNAGRRLEQGRRDAPSNPGHDAPAPASGAQLPRCAASLCVTHGWGG